MKYYISKEHWEQIYKFLKAFKGIHSKKEEPLRKFIEAVWYVTRGGCQWRLLPPYYGCLHAIHQRFRRWSKKGIWQKLFEHFQDFVDLQSTMIDGRTIVRAHACAS